MTTTFRIEPTGSKDMGFCACCGRSTRRIWGLVYADGHARASYFIQWADGHVSEDGANIDLVVGDWGEKTTAEDRCAISLLYRQMASGPAMMVISANKQLATLATRLLSRNEVVNTSLAGETFAIADAILDQDDRLAKLLQPFKPFPSH